jgi:hypothetical protein
MDYGTQTSSPKTMDQIPTKLVSTLERYRIQRDEMVRRLDDLNQLIVLLEGDQKMQKILTLMARV